MQIISTTTLFISFFLLITKLHGTCQLFPTNAVECKNVKATSFSAKHSNCWQVKENIGQLIILSLLHSDVCSGLPQKQSDFECFSSCC